MYTLLFTWKYAFHEAACFKGLFWTHEKVILLCIPEAGVLYKLGQLKWKVKGIPPPSSMKEEFIIDSGGGGWDSSLFPVTTSFGITQNLYVEWCMFIIGVGCNFFRNSCSSGLYLKFSFDFFFRQTFSFIQVFYLIALFFAEISI